ncbi:MAG: UDP-N-acetylmuramoyl-tripeptide--D-alanyl-D-alanine ligase [Clostridiales Family XIII bacterium]|nr:UDP-N-acetylmuramoyl-tripeptide--D-alanyl-D-alanine ligase [Clostridiales Family XIII bacterium]
MKELTVGETIKAVGGRLVFGRENAVYHGVSADSRTLVAGNLFVALRGDLFDGHEFLPEAVRRGCGALMVSDANSIPSDFDGAAIETADTLRAYQDLAAYYRELIDPKTIAITGSMGKTTLKDMIASVCETEYRTIRSRKNFNNHIGVPLTIFEMDEDTEILILEMGMNHEGEIRRLAEIGRPHIAVISNAGLSHRENFDSDEGVFNAKTEIATFLGEGDILAVNGDDPRFARMASRRDTAYRVVTAGTREDCDFKVSDVRYTGDAEISFDLKHGGDTTQFVLPAAGLYNGVNAAFATAVANELGIGANRVAEALRAMERTPGRLQLLERDGIKVIDDTYNAGPDSMRSGLEYLMALSGRRKIAVLAGMNELGEESSAFHREVGYCAVSLGVNLLVTVGEKAQDIAAGAQEARNDDRAEPRLLHFANNESAIAFLLGQEREGDAYLVKGSRTMRMEEVARSLARIMPKPRLPIAFESEEDNG